MGKIHFKDDVKVATWKAIEEAHDCADVATDLLRIQNTIAYGTDEEATRLDLELWKKVPCNQCYAANCKFSAGTAVSVRGCGSR